MNDSRIILWDEKNIVITYEDSLLFVPGEFNGLIETFWQDTIRENKNMFNGPVIGLSEIEEGSHSTALTFQNTSYAHFMASHFDRIPQKYHSRSFYTSALIITSDGLAAFGQMGQNSFDSGRYQYIGGGMEKEFMLEGQSGYEKCILCELEEELGLTGNQIVQNKPLYLSLGQKQENISLIFKTTLSLSSEELVSQLGNHNKELAKSGMVPEVDDLLFVTTHDYKAVLEGLLPAHLDENLYSSLAAYFSS